MKTSVKLSKVADVSCQAALNKKKERRKKDNTTFPLVRFVSKIALLFLCGPVAICMATFRVQRCQADSEMKDIQLLL